MDIKKIYMKLKFSCFIAIWSIAMNVCANETDSLGFIQNRIHDIQLSDSILHQLNLSYLKVDSLMSENLVIKNLLKDSQKETEQKEREISRLKKNLEDVQNITIKKLEASNDSLQRKLISMASNFLYIPYDQYSIEEIAIPAFKATIGSRAYSKYSNRLPLFENYRSHISSLIEFLDKAEKETSIPLTAMRDSKASESLNAMSLLPVYIEYIQYNDWENTYMGKQILSIQRILKSPDKNTPNQLKEIRIKLEGLLNN